MKEEIISKAYAQALIELSEKEGVDAPKEFEELSVLINKSNELETVMFMDVFTIEEKYDVIEKILNKMNTSKIFKNFILFLVNEKRLALFPMIFKNVIVIDDHNKGFLRGTIEGPEADMPTDFKEKIKSYLENKISKKCELNYKENKNITAGYRVTVEDLQLDASLDNQLDNLKRTILSE